MKTHFTNEELLIGWTGLKGLPIGRVSLYELIKAKKIKSILVSSPGQGPRRGRRLVSIASVNAYFEELSKQQSGQELRPIEHHGKVLRGRPKGKEAAA
jgi:hypothetical protein